VRAGAGSTRILDVGDPGPVPLQPRTLV